MKKVIFLIAVILLFATGLISAEQVKIATIITSPMSKTTTRAKHLAVGKTYSDPDIVPETVFTDAPDVDLIIEGNMGIGTKTPSVKLQVVGETLIGSPIAGASFDGVPFFFSNKKNVLWFNAYNKVAAGDYGVIYGEQTYAGGINVFRLNILSGDNRGTPNADDEVFIGNVNHDDSSKAGLIVKSGMVGIGTVTPTEKLTVFNDTSTGTYSTTGWEHTSDMRLKTDIIKVDNALGKIMAIDGVYFKWKNNPEAGRQIGLIAQDIMNVLPEVVSKGNDGYYSIAYDQVIPAFVNASKELKERGDSLEARIAKLEARIAK